MNEWFWRGEASETVRPWRPLLENDGVARAHEAIAAIADDIASGSVQVSPGLNGCAGHALLFAYLADAYGDDERYVTLAEQFHARAVAEAEQQGLAPSLFGGWTGIGWVDAHLSNSFFDPEEDDDPCELDRALAGLLQHRPWRGEYDLISGLVGFGVYALERVNRPSAQTCLERIVACLSETAEERDGGLTWHTPPERLMSGTRASFPEGYYNLGAAHGVPGVIAFLAMCVSAGIAEARAQMLLHGAVRWLLRQQLDSHERSAFADCKAPGMSQTPSRLAWCYGDLGPAVALLLAARATAHSEWKELAIDIALRAAVRPLEHSGVVDGGLCHGAAGLAQIFQRLYWMTALPAFRQSAHVWLGRLLAMRQPGTGVGGYMSWTAPRLPDGRAVVGQLSWRSDASLLTGSSGIALALLAGVSNVSPDWDRLFLLSLHNERQL